MRDRILIVGLVVALCGVSFVGGYQIHEPRVVTETETVTEVETVEVPEVVTKTETKVEKVKVEDTQVVRDEVYVEDIEVSDTYMVSCEDNNHDGEIDSGTAVHPSDRKGVSIQYDEESEGIVTVIDHTEYEWVGGEPTISKENFNRLVEDQCGISPEENQEEIESTFGGDGS